jgi:hypothetical protein
LRRNCLHIPLLNISWRQRGFSHYRWVIGIRVIIVRIRIVWIRISPPKVEPYSHVPVSYTSMSTADMPTPSACMAMPYSTAMPGSCKGYPTNSYPCHQYESAK